MILWLCGSFVRVLLREPEIKWKKSIFDMRGLQWSKVTFLRALFVVNNTFYYQHIESLVFILDDGHLVLRGVFTRSTSIMWRPTDQRTKGHSPMNERKERVIFLSQTVSTTSQPATTSPSVTPSPSTSAPPSNCVNVARVDGMYQDPATVQASSSLVAHPPQVSTKSQPSCKHLQA